MTDPLYMDEARIAERVLGKGRLAEWRGIAAILERDQFPKIDTLFGGRYMPAVRAWLDAYNRVAQIVPPRRGRETWPAAKPQVYSGDPVSGREISHIGSRERT